jgi:hypothetical protein
MVKTAMNALAILCVPSILRYGNVISIATMHAVSAVLPGQIVFAMNIAQNWYVGS